MPAAQPGFFLKPADLRSKAGTSQLALMPGNHDRYRGYCWGAGSTEFDDVFQRYWGVGQAAQYCLIGSPDTDDSLAIVLADFSLASCGDAEPGCLGQGRAYPHVIDQVTKLTAKVRRNWPRAAVVWAVHFAPECPNVDRYLQLIEGSQLLRAAVAANVGHIFCGHTHESAVYEAAGVTIHCAGTACSADNRNSNYIHVRDVKVKGEAALKIDSSDFRWDGFTSFVL